MDAPQMLAIILVAETAALECEQRFAVDAATQRLHDWRRARRPDPDRPVPVQFNTWYACDEDVEESRVLALVPQAAALGCEVFVLDAGWYTTHAWAPLSNWHSRAGDWLIDPEHFPRGLVYVADAVREAGMGFGIWCEPEAVGAWSRLRHERPDWLHHIDGRAPGGDGRAVLHLGVPGAWRHAFDLLVDLVRGTGAGWLKWDFNADLAAGGWAPGLGGAVVRGKGRASRGVVCVSVAGRDSAGICAAGVGGWGAAFGGRACGVDRGWASGGAGGKIQFGVGGDRGLLIVLIS